MARTAHRLAELVAVATLALAAGASGTARAAVPEGMPGAMPELGGSGAGGANTPIAALEGVDVDEKLGARLPLDVTLRDETGAPIRLGTLFGDGLPTLLTFNYSNCPMLCSVMLGGLTQALTQLEWSAGAQFRIITVGLDPAETHEKAMETKMAYLGRYGRPTAEEGWRFLTGDAATVKALTDAVGFGYRIEPKTGEILHPAVLMAISSEGVVSRYVYGVEFDPAELKSVIIQTGLGTITESSKKFLLACFHFEPASGFAASAMKVMRLGGLAFLIVGGFFLIRSIRSSRQARERLAGSA